MLQIISQRSPPARALKHLSEFIKDPRGFSVSMLENISASCGGLQGSEVVAINAERRFTLVYHRGRVAAATHGSCAFAATFHDYKDGETWYEYVS